MSLSKWAGVHPYVADRVRWILGIADQYGGKYTVLSGVRTNSKQFELWKDQYGTGRVAAAPGCSQHNYGFAMDVHFPDPAWSNWFGQVASQIGLMEVAGDPGHVQVWPGWKFMEILQPYAVCPDRKYTAAMGAFDTYQAAIRECAAAPGRFGSNFDESCVFLGS